eukprot:scaffold4149_cov61-Phaeocystis_antarctica.AAC.3
MASPPAKRRGHAADNVVYSYAWAGLLRYEAIDLCVRAHGFTPGAPGQAARPRCQDNAVYSDTRGAGLTSRGNFQPCEQYICADHAPCFPPLSCNA